MVEVPGDTHATTCTRLTLRDGKRLFLRIKWFTSSFFVTALDFPCSWSYNMTKQEVERRASMFDVSGEEFLSHTRLYLGEYGVSESEYSFEPAVVPRLNRMRLSWTTSWTTTDEARMALFLCKDNNPMELVPDFLNVQMDTILMLQDEARRKKHSQHKKARQLAMRFSAPEKARKRSLSRQAPGREAIRGGFDRLVVKSEFPESTPMFNPSTASYGLNTPTHPPILASSSKPLNLGLYTVERLVPEQETSPLYSPQTPFGFDRPHALGGYVAAPHGQLKSMPSGYQAVSKSKREQARNESIQVPVTDDHDFFLGRAGSSQMTIPVKVDVCNVGHSRPYEHGLPQPGRPSRFHDVAAHGSPTFDQGVMSYEARKQGMEGRWINPRKASTGVESRSTFVNANQGRERAIVLSDSDEETHHDDDDMGAGVDDLLRRYRMPKDDGWQVQDLGRQTRSRKRKERDDAPDREADAGITNGVDNRTKVCVVDAAPARIKVEGEQHSGTFDYGSRAQWKALHHVADNPSGKVSNNSNDESRVDRAQWSTWISEAKTAFLEVPSSEARTHYGDSAKEGSCHLVDQPTENMMKNRSSPRDLEGLQTSPSRKTLDSNLDVVDFPQGDSEYLRSPTETPNFNILRSNGNSVRERERQEDVVAEQPERSYIGKSKNWVASNDPQHERVKLEREIIFVENDGETDSVEEHVYEAGDDGATGVVESAVKKLRDRGNSVSARPLQRGAGSQKFPGRRGRPPGTKSQLQPKPTESKLTKSKLTKSVSQGLTTCPMQSDIEPRNTSLQRSLRAARPVGRPKQTHKHDYVVTRTLVDVDRELQKAVPDSDYYCFDGDRGKEQIKPNEVWALYDDIDSMPRTLIRVMEVSMNGPFWVKAIWLQPQKCSKKKAGFPISIGDFEEPKESTVIRALNCFSHKMEFTPKTTTVIQVYPRKGEIWALYHREKTEEGSKQARSEKGRKGKDKRGNDRDKYQFRLVAVVSNCGEGRGTDILVLRKRTGYRTLWEPGYKKGSIPAEFMERFSHRVPAYKLTEKDYPDLNNLDIWDIDAAAVPTCQSKVT